MKKISELFKVKAVKGDIGVEIEMEGKNLKEVFTDVWTTVNDGSLRGRYPNTCAEFVFAKPLEVQYVERAIINLQEELKGAEFNFSYRTSVHVHVNVQKLEYQQLLAMLYTYYLVEEPLMTFSGKKRKGNNFCLRLQDAEGVLNTIEKMFEHGEFGSKFIPQDQIRYSALNIEAVKKYGSVEFRGMEGNIDPKRISSLAMALVQIREYGAKADTPEAVYDRFNKLGALGFFKEVFGELNDMFIYPRLEKDMLVSYSISIDLPFAFKRFLSKPAKEEEQEYYEGQVVDYETAVAINKAGGLVEGSAIPRMYLVVRVPPKAKKPVKAQVYADNLNIAFGAGGGGIIMDDIQGWDEEAPLRR